MGGCCGYARVPWQEPGGGRLPTGAARRRTLSCRAPTAAPPDNAAGIPTDRLPGTTVLLYPPVISCTLPKKARLRSVFRPQFTGRLW